MIMTLKQFNVDDFIALKPHPLQRPTKQHALRQLKGGHFKEYHPTHGRVVTGNIKGQVTIYIVDGHSRGYLWEHDLLEQPKELLSDHYECDTREEFIDLYKTFDSDTAVERNGQKIHGAFGYYGFHPRKPYMFSVGGMTGAMRVMAFPSKYGDDRALSIYDLVEPWIPSLKQIDALDPYFIHTLFPGFVTVAMLMSVKRDGNGALSFWQAYHDDEGSKTKVSKDGIFAARELQAALYGNREMNKGGYGGVRYYGKLFWYFYDQWAHNKRIPNNLRYLNQKFNKELPSLSETWREEIGDYHYPQIRTTTTNE